MPVDQRVDRRGHPGLVEAREHRGQPRLARRAEHCRGRGQRGGVGLQPRQQRPGDGGRADRADAPRGGRLGQRHAAGAELVEQQPRQERVAAAGRVDGGRDLGRGRHAVLLAELGDGLLRQRAGLEALGVAGGDEVGQRAGVPVRRPGAHDDEDRQVGDPARQVGEEAQRRDVGPLRVVDRDQQGAKRRQVGRDPPERVQGPGRGRVAGRGFVGRVAECTQGGARRPVEEGLARLAGVAQDRALDKLAHHAPGHRALELVPRGLEAAEAAELGQRAGVADQPRLADAGGPLDDHGPAVPRGGRIERGRDRVELLLALERVDRGRHPARA
jgi:hypothetical protein